MFRSKPVVELLGNSIESWSWHAPRLDLGDLAGAMNIKGCQGWMISSTCRVINTA